MRFTIEPLVAAGAARQARTGRVHATVRVTVDHAHARHAVVRGADLTAKDVVAGRHEIEAGPLRPLPTLADAGRSRALQHLAEDACLGRAALAVAPTVRSGEGVIAIARAAGAQVSATMVAIQSGNTGSVIRVVNQDSRRALKARVVATGIVEIIHD